MIKNWFLDSWMYAGFVAGLFLLAVMPIFSQQANLPLLLIYLQLPVYMIHQFEEHDHDRFRNWANEVIHADIVHDQHTCGRSGSRRLKWRPNSPAAVFAAA